MDLKTVFSSVSAKITGEKKTKESFLSVKISSTQVSVATWIIDEGKVELGNVSQTEVLGDSFEDLLAATDKAISHVGGLEEKAIFGLPFPWVEMGKVVPEKLSILRQLCKELGLKPMGFVLLPEVLENYYKETEGAPLTAILLEIDGPQGILTMYRAGKNLGTVEIKVTASEIVGEIEKALKQFSQVEVLPSRIIIFDSRGNLEALSEKITAHPWTKAHAFLHFPKVEVLPSENVVKAIAIAGALEMGGHLDESGPELEEIGAREAGFSPEPQFESFGQLQEIETPPQAPAIIKEKTNYQGIFTAWKEKVVKLFGRLKIKPTLKIKFAFPVLGFLLIFLCVIGVSLYFFPKAKIIIRVATTPFDKEMPVGVLTQENQKSATDSAKAVSGSIISITRIGTQKGVATGKKLVGDKAKGNITIHSASNAKTFVAGSTVFSPTGLKFTLDRDTSVASGDAITRATANVPVIASDIGESYNLPAGTKFTLGSLSSSQYAAQADQAFSGGNSYEATVVTKEDQARLLTSLSAELSDKARADLEAKLSSSQKLLPTAITSVVSKKKFSKDIGAEGDTVSLDLTTDFQGVIFSQNDLVEVFAKNFSSDIPADYTLLSPNANLEIKDVKTDKFGNAVLKVRLTSGLLPKIDTVKLIKIISGKSFTFATNYISKLSGVTGLNIEIKPRIMEKIVKLVLPWRPNSITVDITSE